MNTLALLKKRKEIKAKKTYTRSDGKKRIRISHTGWRRPKGHQSKVRLNLRGYGKQIQVGFGSPKEVRGMHANGLMPVTIATTKVFAALDPKKHCIIIGAVGMKKKAMLVAEAQKRKFSIINIKNSDTFVQDVQKKVEERKNAKKLSKDAKTKKKSEKTLEKKVEKEKSVEKDQKQMEKEEKEKILTQKE